MILAILVPVFGLVFVYRTISDMHADHVITQPMMTKIGTAFVVVVIFHTILSKNNYLIMWLGYFFLFLVLKVLEILLRNYRRHQFNEKIPLVLSQIIMSMRTGKSFRDSFAQTIESSDPFSQRILQEIWNVVVYLQQKPQQILSPSVNLLLEEFLKVDAQAHKSVDRLKAYRRKLKTEDFFRRKSGQALSQIRLQSLIMSLLYLALLSYVCLNFGFHENQKLIFVSTVLFITGLVWVFKAGRKMRWKV